MDFSALTSCPSCGEKLLGVGPLSQKTHSEGVRPRSLPEDGAGDWPDVIRDARKEALGVVF